MGLFFVFWQPRRNDFPAIEGKRGPEPGEAWVLPFPSLLSGSSASGDSVEDGTTEQDLGRLGSGSGCPL